jgi:hypothetical protein
VGKIHAANLVPEPEAIDLRRLIEMRTRNADRGILRRFLNPDPSMDITNLTAKLDMPVLVMRGTADTQLPFEGSEYLAR